MINEQHQAVVERAVLDRAGTQVRLRAATSARLLVLTGETQVMLDYSVANNIYPQVEVIPITKIDEAYENVIGGNVKFRYVIDMKSLG